LVMSLVLEEVQVLQFEDMKVKKESFMLEQGTLMKEQEILKKELEILEKVQETLMKVLGTLEKEEENSVKGSQMVEDCKVKMMGITEVGMKELQLAGSLEELD